MNSTVAKINEKIEKFADPQERERLAEKISNQYGNSFLAKNNGDFNMAPVFYGQTVEVFKSKLRNF